MAFSLSFPFLTLLLISSLVLISAQAPGAAPSTAPKLSPTPAPVLSPVPVASPPVITPASSPLASPPVATSETPVKAPVATPTEAPAASPEFVISFSSPPRAEAPTESAGVRSVVSYVGLAGSFLLLAAF